MTESPPIRSASFEVLTVSEVTRLCEDAAAITFDGGCAFRAGQALTLRRRVAGRDERRTYSICAPEGARPRIGVREVPGGLFSSWLVRSVRPGDRIEVGSPSGTFTPGDDPSGTHVMIAAGSGITPVLSVAATVLRNPDARVALLYGNRRASTVMFADELADLKDRYPARLHLVHVLSREPREAELLTGRLDPAKLACLLPLVAADPARVDHWWLCGPLPMITEATGFLRSRGVPASRIHRELFYAGDAPPPTPPARPADAPLSGGATPCSEVTIVLDGRATRVTVPRDTTILSGAQRVRPDVPFACRGAVCGTCRARITHGRADMRRNFALEEPELAAGYILTCQSLPATDNLTVNYDLR